MARPDRLDHYFLVGIEGLRLVEDALATAGRPDPATILDLPCGYGRVLRMLRAAFPEAAITACDLDRGGVEFCERTFGVEGAFSERQLDELSLGRTYELVWCGSLLTHLPEEDARAALRALARHLAPEGLLVFTTHGERDPQAARRRTSPRGRRRPGQARAPAGLRARRGTGQVRAPAGLRRGGVRLRALSGFARCELRVRALVARLGRGQAGRVAGVVHLSSRGAAWHGRQDVYVCQGARD